MIKLFSDFNTITNTICSLQEDGVTEDYCSSTTTILFGDVTNKVDEINKTIDLHLFPNPTDNQLQISTPELINEKVSITIYNMDGRIQQQQLYDHFLSETISLAQRPPGIYILQFRAEDRISTHKVVVN